jgi:hypothetical protein
VINCGQVKAPLSNEMGADFSLNSLVSDAWLSF